MSALFVTSTPITLASASPRRRDLLTGVGVICDVLPAGVEEPAPEPGEAPAAYALRMARLKCGDGASPGTVRLAADTVVAVDGQILGKPTNDADALRMLTLLAGREHEVTTGVCLANGLATGDDPAPDPVAFAVTTRVRFVDVDVAVLRAYVATGEPRGKAGAYAIQGQGSALVAGIEGSYTNVVGLPLAEVVQVLLGWGAVVPAPE